MAKKISFTLVPVAGSVALEKLIDTTAEAFPDSRFHLIIRTNLGEPHWDIENLPAGEARAHPQVVDAVTQLAGCGFISCKSIVLAGFPAGGELRYDLEDDSITGRIHIQVPEQDHVKHATRLAGILAKRFSFISPTEIFRDAWPREIQQGLQLYERTLSSLTEEVSRLGQFNAEQIKRQSEYFDKRQGEQDAREEQRKLALETTFAKKQADVERQEREHKERVAHFEMRESKYVRRDLLARMQGKIEEQKQITLSAHTIRKRWIIHVICVAALLAGAIAALLCGSKVLSAETFHWHNMAPLTAAVLLFGSTVIYYIKWNDEWFKEHAEAEFRNMRFAADILRASWVAELLFEWEREKERELPEAIISRFTHNLFMDGRLRDVEHPAEALSQLLRNIANIGIRIDREGVEINKAAKKPK